MLTTRQALRQYVHRPDGQMVTFSSAMMIDRPTVAGRPCDLRRKWRMFYNFRNLCSTWNVTTH